MPVPALVPYFRLSIWRRSATMSGMALVVARPHARVLVLERAHAAGIGARGARLFELRGEEHAFLAQRRHLLVDLFELALGAVHDRHVHFGELGQLARVGALEVGELRFESGDLGAHALRFTRVELRRIRRAALALAAMFGEECRHQPLRARLRLRGFAMVVRQRERIDDLALAARTRIENRRRHDADADVAPQAHEHGTRIVGEIRIQIVFAWPSCVRLLSVSTMPLRFVTYWSA